MVDSCITEAIEEAELLLYQLLFNLQGHIQKQLFEAGIPTAFNVHNIKKEYERLEKLDVVFHNKQTQLSSVHVAA